MKKQKKLVKRIVALGLVAVLLAVGYIFIFGRDNDKVTKIVLPEIPIIGYFGITGETTTEADIIVVERDLNNTIMTNGYAVKLFLAPEDRYDHMIETAKEVIAKYEEDPTVGYKFEYATSTFSIVENGEAEPVRYDQDVVMEKLEAGENIYPNTLSLDVVLYTDFDEYYIDASEGRLVSLDAALTNAEGEMISLNKCIPEVFLNAVKVGDSETSVKVYGIPTVRAVGEYEFLVFDQGLLDHYSDLIVASEDGAANNEFGFSKNQMQYLGELEKYLRYVKNNAGPDGEEIVPLLNTPRTFTINAEYKMEMLDGNALVADTDGYIKAPYIDITNFSPHYTTITKYRSLGFIADVEDAPEEEGEYKEWIEEKLINDKYAVAFYTGTMGDMESVIKAAAGEDESGKQLVYNVFSAPIATSQEICEAIFAIHGDEGYGNSDYENYAVNFIRLLNGVNGEVDIKNLLLYGAVGVNYTLNSNNEVVLPTTLEGEEGQTYSMDTLYTGHSFHAFPSVDKGISLEGIEFEKQHNQALEESYLSGFSLALSPYSVKDYDGNTIYIDRVDYYQVLCDVVDQFYDDYMNGVLFAVPATDEAYIKENEEKIKETIRDSLIEEYTDMLVEEKTAEIRKQVLADDDFIETSTTKAETIGKEEFIDMTKNAMITEHLELQPTDTAWVPAEEDLTAAVDEFKYYNEAKLEELIQNNLNTLIDTEVRGLMSGYESSVEFTEKMDAYMNGEGFELEVEEEYAEKGDDYLAKFIEREISEKMDVFSGGDGMATSGEFVEMVEKAFAEANSEHKAYISREYPFVDVNNELSFCSSYLDVIKLFEEQYYALKGKPAGL